MKGFERNTSRGRVVALLCVAVLGGSMLAAAGPGQEEKRSRLRVGVFDSRAVAIAWLRSETYEASLREKSAEFEKAKEAGDETRVKEIEAGMRAIQDEIHKQGFGIWPIRDILAHIKDDLKKIATETEVDVIVCKWDLAYRRPEAEFIDVTSLMVKPFEPDEETMKIVKEIQTQEPIPLEELKGHSDD